MSGTASLGKDHRLVGAGNREEPLHHHRGPPSRTQRLRNRGAGTGEGQGRLGRPSLKFDRHSRWTGGGGRRNLDQTGGCHPGIPHGHRARDSARKAFGVTVQARGGRKDEIVSTGNGRDPVCGAITRQTETGCGSNPLRSRTVGEQELVQCTPSPQFLPSWPLSRSRIILKTSSPTGHLLLFHPRSTILQVSDATRL